MSSNYVFQYKSDGLFRDPETADPIEDQDGFQGLCIVYGFDREVPKAMAFMTWLVQTNHEDEPETFKRLWQIPGNPNVPTLITQHKCPLCRQKYTLKFYQHEPVYKPFSDDICPECWEERERARYARIGLSEALGPGQAVFDGAW